MITNIENLMRLRAHLARVPAELIRLGEPGAEACGIKSLLGWAMELIRRDVTLESGLIVPPSSAEWLGTGYDETLALFFMRAMPADQPQCDRKQLDRACFTKQEVFDAHPPKLRKAVLISVLDIAIETGRIDWRAAKDAHGVECAA